MKTRHAAPVVTLTTDFGLEDAYVGIMKGVILGISPNVQIVDLTHNIPPQSIMAAAITLAAAVDYFPDGTIHAAIVDPGVGTARRAIAVRTARAFYVAPDNGLLSFVLQKDPARAIVHLDKPRYWRQSVSRTFHGRDVFAPAAAHLADGTPLEELGTPCENVVEYSVPNPSAGRSGAIEGQIIHVDHFGNCTTNIGADALPAGGKIAVRVGDRSLGFLHGTYSEVGRGAPLALVGSAGLLEIAVREGSARQDLELAVGDKVVVTKAAAETA
jgi:S-adenosylmethionine hydrolase